MVGSFEGYSRVPAEKVAANVPTAGDPPAVGSGETVIGQPREVTRAGPTKPAVAATD
jgi:hypothetical protein